MTLSVERPASLGEDDRAAVLALAREVEARDGAPPLSDQALTQLRSPSVSHVLVRAGGRTGARLAGYAQVAGDSLELASPADVLDAVLDAALEHAPDDVLVWSHGRRSPLSDALPRRGFTQVRVLHQLRRALIGSAGLTGPDAGSHAAVPDGVTVRDFVVGVDEPEWLRVNAAAFARHAEQGSWTLADLSARESEPWFDPRGFLVAERAGQLVGFHWTKLHGGGLGEVYVLAVDPAAQGLHLGAALLARGLARLVELGCSEVLLYVDDDNEPAMRLYERQGFRRYDADTQWRRHAMP